MARQEYRDVADGPLRAFKGMNYVLLWVVLGSLGIATITVFDFLSDTDFDYVRFELGGVIVWLAGLGVLGKRATEAFTPDE